MKTFKRILLVKNMGIGFSKDKMDKFFEPFTYGKFEGHITKRIGLGLTISRKLSGIIGGKKSGENEADKGI